MFIGALQKTTLVDFPNKVACIVFLVNCNFKCKFCYNRELTSHKFFKKSKRELIDEKDFFNFIESKKKMLDGVVITGGEPTLSPGLTSFLRKIKSLGFAIKLDTNGTNPGILKKLFAERLVDYVAMDFKAPFEKYPKITQSEISSEKILGSIDLIKTSGVAHEFRTTLYPLLTINDLLEMAKVLKGEKWFLQNFQPENALEVKSRRLKPMKVSQIKEFIKEVKPLVNVSLRGED
ncbi:MAG: anaerobic ribonucleoside-triphosphate reductase activating protein [Candidatus Diapherotrites archaeon]|nr:anaerobic ribonucleoside-triphosphate reductase activating protein [Candidatus Diapherotrites archaeon]